jgi:uncharacterized protein YajQ (UPF0234 family)
MPSFDIVSELDLQEVDNAINQARKESGARYDFRGSKAEIQWDKKVLALVAEDDYKVNALKDILQSKMHKRGIDISAIKFEPPVPIGGMLLKITCELKQGIDKETAKKIVKHIKDGKLKVEAQINDDTVRVSSKSIDTLQECISHVKSSQFGLPLQFQNMRS